jgi:hypothetical protein
MRLIATGLAALLLAGCATHDWTKIPVPGPEARNADQRIKDHRDYCKKTINSDDYIDCLGSNPERTDSVGASITWPRKPKEEMKLVSR